MRTSRTVGGDVDATAVARESLGVESDLHARASKRAAEVVLCPHGDQVLLGEHLGWLAWILHHVVQPEPGDLAFLRRG